MPSGRGSNCLERAKTSSGSLYANTLILSNLALKMSSSELAELAYEISVENKITFYDSLFLAAAEKEKVPIYTIG
jgi:predicted nucleic acid-binding protein